MYTGEVEDTSLTGPIAPESRGAFSEPWTMRVVDVDEATLDALMNELIVQRRMKFGLAAAAFFAGLAWVGFKDFGAWHYSLLAYVILGGVTFMPCYAIGSLVVRYLFLREAKSHGLSRSTGLLLLTRAERRARSMSVWDKVFWKGREQKIKALAAAVRDWDKAD